MTHADRPSSSSAAPPPRLDAPPSEEPLSPLFTPRQIFWSSLFATPVSGAVLIGANLDALRRRGGKAWILGSLILLAMAGALDVVVDPNGSLPFGWIGAIVSLAMAIAYGAYANRAFAPVLTISNRCPAYAAVGRALLISVAVFVTAATVEYLAIYHGPLWLRGPLAQAVFHSEIQWATYEASTRQEAERVMAAVATIGTFEEDDPFSFEVASDDGQLVLRLFYSFEDLKNPEVHEWASRWAKELANAVEPRACVRVDLLDDNGWRARSHLGCPSSS